MQEIVVSEVKPRVPPQWGHHDRVHFDGQRNAGHIRHGATPENARRELLLNQDLVETSGGASICAWVDVGRVNVWLCSSGGKATSIDLLPSEVDSLIEMLHLGKEAV